MLNVQEQEYSSQMYPVGGLVYYISPPTSLSDVSQLGFEDEVFAAPPSQHNESCDI
jgi:hypothetical protein